MIINSQQSCLAELNSLASADRHSVLIEGPPGSGKSYMAKQFADMLGISDFYSVPPNVQSIRSMIESAYNSAADVVVCIENLDTGVASASFTLLKFLEEPTSNVYVVVTCRNRYNVPDTIISRSSCVTSTAPTEADIAAYAATCDKFKFAKLEHREVWKAVSSFNDVDTLLKFSDAQIDYFDALKSMLSFKDSVSSLSWKLTHFNDNSAIDPAFVLGYIFRTTTSSRIRRYAVACMKDLMSANVASHAVLSKFLMECKYGD